MAIPASYLLLKTVLQLASSISHQQGVPFTRDLVPKKGARGRNGRTHKYQKCRNKSNQRTFSNDPRVSGENSVLISPQLASIAFKILNSIKTYSLPEFLSVFLWLENGKPQDSSKTSEIKPELFTTAHTI